MKRGVVISYTGHVTPVAIVEENELTLIQNYVGGYFEVIQHDVPNLTVFADEDGKRKNRPYNTLATSLFGRYLAPDLILGDVLVMGGVDEYGETQGLTPEQTDIFLSPDGEGILNGLIGIDDAARFEAGMDFVEDRFGGEQP